MAGGHERAMSSFAKKFCISYRLSSCSFMKKTKTKTKKKWMRWWHHSAARALPAGLFEMKLRVLRWRVESVSSSRRPCHSSFLFLFSYSSSERCERERTRRGEKEKERNKIRNFLARLFNSRLTRLDGRPLFGPLLLLLLVMVVVALITILFSPFLRLFFFFFTSLLFGQSSLARRRAHRLKVFTPNLFSPLYASTKRTPHLFSHLIATDQKLFF